MTQSERPFSNNLIKTSFSWNAIDIVGGILGMQNKELEMQGYTVGWHTVGEGILGIQRQGSGDAKLHCRIGMLKRIPGNGCFLQRGHRQTRGCKTLMSGWLRRKLRAVERMGAEAKAGSESEPEFPRQRRTNAHSEPQSPWYSASASFGWLETHMPVGLLLQLFLRSHEQMSAHLR